ncbi:NADPH-dependent FMN reductase [Mumia quercus]|uniref:NADPH-dependent FMN reductase n=1 Tax=Mumia quercus TaxID=2976125 RepID=UPI0021D08883|nr:NAD(P)H-dependent oxidoreductase [Mumia quercus]
MTIIDTIGSSISEPSPLRLGVIVGATRPGRKAAQVAAWVRDLAARHPQVQAGRLELRPIDLAEVGLPLLDEPVAAAFGDYLHPHTRTWAETIRACDGFVFVTPEYNHSIPAALKNALDYLYTEWHHKPAGIVSYGLVGGTRAAQHLRTILLELKSVPVGEVTLSVFEDFTYTDMTDPASPFEVAPRDHQPPAVIELLDHLVAYAEALAPLRVALAPIVGATVAGAGGDATGP